MVNGNETGNDAETTGTRADSGERPDGGDGSDSDGGGRNDRDGGDESDGEGSDKRILHRKVTPDAEEANRNLLGLLADVEGCEVTDLPPLYDQVDHLVEHLFSDPPPADAQAELEFSYHGYRIELDQTGNVSLMRLAEEFPAPQESTEHEGSAESE